MLTAPPGSGKTTRVPLHLLDADWLGGATISLLEPRRPAARMAAARMASLLGEQVGERVGYQVRFERRIGAETRIQVLTEGILTRRLQSDPALEGVGLIIFDEFHERGLQADLGLALALDTVAGLRPDLRLLIMSATLDADAAAGILGGAPVVRAEGSMYPVETRYLERAAADPIDAMAPAINEALAERSGDILAFLPGAGEIERVRRALSHTLDARIDCLALHGALPLDAQQRALVPSGDGRRRVILATDIAETSLTIEGVSQVVDSGLARKPRLDPASGLTRLVTAPITLDSAEQRAGRAGRLGPGSCLRLWTRGQEVGRTRHRRAEILDADLAPLVLELAAWGVSDPAALAWLDPPPERHIEQARALLRQLGALDAKRRITRLGRRIAEHPVHPRLARMLVTGRELHAGRLAADLAALLCERDPWRIRPGEPRPADLGLRLSALTALRNTSRPNPDHRDATMDRAALAAADRLSRRLRQRESADSATLEPGALLALAYPERIAQRRTERGERYLLALGTGAELPRDDTLAVHRYLVAAELDARGRDARIRLALPIAEQTLRQVLAERIRTEQIQVWDPAAEAVSARSETRLDALVLDTRTIPVFDPAAALDLLLAEIRRRPDRILPWDREARQLQARVALVRGFEPDAGWPDLADDTLAAGIDAWLAPWLDGKWSIAALGSLKLADILAGQLAWDQQQRLDQLAPRTLTTPAGSQRRLDYGDGDAPVLAVPIQELFGTAENPTICAGRLPLTLHLLSPAGRPAQITRDLAGFWAGSYAEVRKELRGRYPKHHWPDDPLAAAPTRHAKRRPRP